MFTEKQFLTVAETADILRVQPLKIYRDTEAGRIPRVKIGSKTLVPSSYIQGLLDAALTNEGGSHD